MSDTSKIIQSCEAILKELFIKNIPLVQLRYKEFDEASIFKGDYDLFISFTHLDIFLKTFFKVCSSHAINFFIERKKYGKMKLFLYNDASQYVTFEIWSYLDVKDSEKKVAKYTDAKRIEKFILRGETSYHFSHEIETLYYLSHLYSKSKSLESAEVTKRLYYYKELLSTTQHDYFTLIALLQNLLEKQITIQEAAKKANSRLLELGFFREYKSFDKISTLIRFKNELQKLFFSLSGTKIVPILGQDGVGKTSATQSIIESDKKKFKYYRFKKLFRKSLLYKLCYKIYRTQIDKTLEKNQVDDLMGTCVIFSALTHYPFLFLGTLFSKRTLFSDRYFDDYLLQNVRFDDKELCLRANSKQLLKLIPRQKLHLQLDCDTQIILSRKQEMAPHNIDLYREKIFELYLLKPSFLYGYINTANTLEHNEKILKAMLEYNK